MRKRMLAWLLVVAMMVSQFPTAVFATETETQTEPVAQTEQTQSVNQPTEEMNVTEPTKAAEVTEVTEPAKATEETELSEPTKATEVTEPSESTAEPSEPTEKTTAPAEETTAPTEVVDEAVAAVEAQIADLPMVSSLETMGDDALTELYATAQAIADAYDALTEEQQGKVANFETLVAFLNWFAVPETMDTNVAQIGEQGYPTFNAAYEAAQNGDTITLLADAEFTLENNQAASIDKSITIKLNGNKLCTKGLYGSKPTEVDADDVTIQGPGTVEQGVDIYLGSASLTDATIGGSVRVESGTSLTMRSGSVSDYLSVEANTTVTLYGGKFGHISRDSAAPTFSEMLAKGYVFKDGDGNIVTLQDDDTMLNDVTVGLCTHGDWKDVDGKYTCGDCGFICTHENTCDPLTGKCSICQKNIAVAKVTSTTGGTTVINYYQTFPEAYGAVTSNKGDTLTLLQDVSMTNTDWNKQVGASLDKSFTFDLNGHSCGIVNTETVAYQVNFGGTVTVKNGTIPYLLAMSDSQVELDGVASTQVTCNYGGKLEVKGNCNIPILICQAGGKLTVRGGKIGSLTVNDSVTTDVALTGGSFTKITISNALTGHDVPSFLPSGYIYRKNTESDTSYLKNSELKGKSTLENVTVIECPHPSFAEPDEDGYVKCDYCDSCCVHTSGVDTDGKCNTCKTQMEVEVTCTDGGSEITFYRPKLTAALAQIPDESSNITVKLLKNVTHTNAGENITIDKSMTLDLNGKTLDVGTGALLFRTTATLKNGTVKGNVTAKPDADVKDMKLTVESVTVENGELWVDGVTSPVSVTVKDGSLNELRVESDGQNAQVKLYGGSYGEILNDMMLIPAKSFLPEGYAYQKNGTSLSLSELGNPLKDVTVAKCTTHGAPTDGGLCGYCNTALEASVTVGENTTYYASFTDALDYVNKSTTGGATVKVLKDATVSVSATYTLSKSMTLDLNGKTLTPTHAPFITVNGCTLTVKSSESGGNLLGRIQSKTATSEIKVESGKIMEFFVYEGKTTISGGTFETIQCTNGIGSLLEEGYGFCIRESIKKTWYDETCSETSLKDQSNYVTVAKLPITDVSIVKNPDVTNVELGNSVDMTAKVIVAEGHSANDIAYSWRRDGAVVDWDSEWSCQFTDDYIDKDVTVTLEATLDGYTRSTSVTFRGEKATIANYTAPKAKDETLTFGDGTALFVAGDSNNAGMFHYRVDEDGAWVNSVPTNSGLTAGKHTIYWYIDGGDLYKDVGSQDKPAGSFKVTIQKATVTSHDYVVDHQTLSYSATAQKLVTVRLDKAGTKFWYKLGDGDWQTDIPTATDAGTYSVSYYIDGGDNYNDVGSKDKPAGTIEVTIQPREVTITPLNRNKPYGEDDPVLGYQYSIIEADENNYLQLESAFEAARTGTLSRAEGEDVSAQGYIITLGTLSAGKNFKLTLDTIDKLLTINPKDVSREITELNKQTVFTGIGEFTQPSFKDDKGNPITGTLEYRMNLPMTYEAIRAALKDGEVGHTYSISYTFTASGNYTGTITGTINVTVVDVLFDVAEGAVTTVTNGTYGDSWDDLVTLDSSKITAIRADSKVEGTYTIVPDSGTLEALPKAGTQNFKVVFNSKDGKYQNITVTSGSVTLAKKQLTVTAGTFKVTKTYDGTTAPGTVSGVFEVDEIVGSDEVQALVFYELYYNSANAGTTNNPVTVTLSGKDRDNYELSSASVTVPFEITKATLTASNVTASAVYGKMVKDIPVTGTVTFGDTPINGTWSFDSNDEAIPNVNDPGTYTATFTLTDTELAKNFNTLTVEVTPTITKANAKVLLSGVTLSGYRGNPLSTIVLGNGWSWDTPDAKIGAEDTTYSATYEDTTGNYESGTHSLTVEVLDKTQKTLDVTISGWTYGDSPNAPQYTAPEGVMKQKVTYTGTDYSSETAPENAGDYTVTVRCETLTEIYEGSATFTIDKRDIQDAVITLYPIDQTYTGSEQSRAVATVTVNKKSLTLGTDYSVSCTAQKNVGKYPLTITGKGNYTGTASTTWEITPAEIEASTAQLVSKTYDGTNTGAVTSVTFDGLLRGDTLKLGEDYTATVTYASSQAGNQTATIQVTLKDTVMGKNYKLINSGSFTQNSTISPKAVTAVLTVPDKQYDGKTDTVVNAIIAPADLVSGDSITITGITGTFAQSDVGENLTVKVDTTGKTITGAENYTVTIPTVDIKGNIVNTWQPKNGTEFATPATNGAGWLTEIPTITAKEGYKISLQNKADDKSWIESYQPSDAETTEVTFYVRNETTGAISLPVTYTYKLDKHEGGNKTVATVSMEGIEDVWEELVEDVYFDQLLKENATIKVKAKDTVSGVKKVEYLDSATALTVKQLQSPTGWSVMSTATDEDGYAIGTVTIPVVDGKQFVCYIRITDNADNVTYFSTNGVTFDTVAPTIEGVTNGETSYTTRVVTISDKNLNKVTLNDEPQTLTDGKLTLPGDVEKTYTIVATDKVGNSTTVTVKMLPISSITSDLEGLTVYNVTSASQKALEDAKSTIAKELTNKNATSEEKDALNMELNKVNNLLNKLEEVAKAMNTDNIQKVKDITADNVKLEDKDALEKAKTDLNKVLTDSKNNLTVAEKKSLNDQLDTIDKALKVIENVENVEKLIGDLPKTITSKDSTAIKASEKAYDALTEHEKSLVSKDSVKKLQAARKALDRLNAKVTSPSTGDDSHMILWCSLLLLSAATLAMLEKKRKPIR